MPRACTEAMLARVRASIGLYPDFPEPGVEFRDIVPMLIDGGTLGDCLHLMENQAADLRPDIVLGTESRGFVFAVPVADRLEAGFLPARKPGKLPGKVVRQAYGKEYGKDALELPLLDLTGKRVLVVDDLLATGGTAAAAEALVGQLGGQVVGFVFLIELESFNGRRMLGWGKPPGEVPVRSVLRYP